MAAVPDPVVRFPPGQVGGDRLNQLRKLNRLGRYEPVKSLKNLLENLATS